MDTAVGVKTAIIGFIFVCIVMPQIIKNRHQYYLALTAVILGILLQALATMVNSWPGTPDGHFGRFCLVANHLLDIFAILLLVMAAGGISTGQLAGNMARAYEVLRRGETEKEIIIPLGDQPPKAREKAQGNRAPGDEPEAGRYTIDDPSAGTTPAHSPPPDAPPPPKNDSSGPLPLE